MSIKHENTFACLRHFQSPVSLQRVNRSKGQTFIHMRGLWLGIPQFLTLQPTVDMVSYASAGRLQRHTMRRDLHSKLNRRPEYGDE